MAHPQTHPYIHTYIPLFALTEKQNMDLRLYPFQQRTLPQDSIETLIMLFMIFWKCVHIRLQHIACASLFAKLYQHTQVTSHLQSSQPPSHNTLPSHINHTYTPPHPNTHIHTWNVRKKKAAPSSGLNQNWSARLTCIRWIKRSACGLMVRPIRSRSISVTEWLGFDCRT